MTTAIKPTRPDRYREVSSAQRYQTKSEGISLGRRLSHWLEAAALRRALKSARGESVLDAPCGTGRIDPLLRQRFKRVVGLDSSQAMLDVYCASDPAREGHCGDIFDLPFPADAFDWVVCHRLFHHFSADEQRVNLLQSLARVARCGIIFYAWINTPLSRRGGSKRKTIDRAHLVDLIQRAGLTPKSFHFAAWPFQPKAEVVCTKANATPNAESLPH